LKTQGELNTILAGISWESKRLRMQNTDHCWLTL